MTSANQSRHARVQAKVRRTAPAVAAGIIVACLVAGCSDGDTKPPAQTVTATVTATTTAHDPGAASPTDSKNAAAGSSTPDVDSVRTWPAKWCQAQPGISKQQLVDLMGPPTSDFGPESGDPQSSWSFAEYQFNAFYDLDGAVRQLDINTISLTEAEQAALTCDTTRTT